MEYFVVILSALISVVIYNLNYLYSKQIQEKGGEMDKKKPSKSV